MRISSSLGPGSQIIFKEHTMSKRANIVLSLAGIVVAILFLAPPQYGVPAAEPAGLGLRLTAATDTADPFSPRNEDGRFDVNTLHVSFAVGPLGLADRRVLIADAAPDPMRHDLEHRGVIVHAHYVVTSAGGGPVFVADRDLPVGAPLEIVYLPVDGGRVAPFAQVTAEIPWDGRDATGAWVDDGLYSTTVSGALDVGTPARANRASALATATGSVTVDNSAPDVETLFPPPASLTDALEVTVRGRVIDPSGVIVVDVNGQPVADLGRLPDWSALIDVARGDNELLLAAEDTVGNRVETSIGTIRSEAALLYQPYPVAYDPVRDRALVGDLILGAVLAIDLDSGERSVLSSAGVGNGPDLPRPSWIEFDAARDRILVFGVVSGQGQTLVAIDPVSGDRAIVSHPATANGPAITSPTGTAIDGTNDRLLVSDRVADALIAIDLASGERSIMSGPSRGNGPDLDDPLELTVDPVRGVAFVPRSRPDIALLAVDLASGDRALAAAATMALPGFSWSAQEMLTDPIDGRLVTLSFTGLMTSFDPDSGDHVVLSDGAALPPQGTGPVLQIARGLAFDAARERLLVTDEDRDQLLAVNRVTGDRSVVSGSSVGSGPPIKFAIPNALALDPVRRHLFYGERAALWAVDLTTAARDVFSGMGHGVGYPLENLRGLEYDAVSDGVYLTDVDRDAVFRIDPSTGDRTLISGDTPAGGGTVGSGDPLAFPSQLAVDPVGGSLLLLDSYAFIQVRLDNGDRAVLADRGVGSIPNTPFFGMAWDADGGRFLTCGTEFASIPAHLLGIDPLTGMGHVVSDAATGAGPLLHGPVDVVLDRPRGRALVVDRYIEGIVAVDLINGDRALVTGDGLGRGPRLAARAIDVDPVRQVAFVSNNDRNELLAIDLLSGDRVIVGK